MREEKLAALRERSRIRREKEAAGEVWVPPAAPRPPREERPPCRYLGVGTGKLVACATCGGQAEKTAAVHACSVRGLCAPSLRRHHEVTGCLGCKDYAPPPVPDPFPGEPVRDLAYHVYPVQGSIAAWRWNVAKLLEKIGLFNGRRVVAIATDAKTASVEEVKAAFRGEVEEFVVVPNDPNLREVATFDALFGRLQTTDPNRCLFYGHAKSVMRGLDRVTRVWTESLYDALLGHWPSVREALERKPVCGAFRWKRAMWKQSRARWFYSGSWYWFRAARLFARDWKRIERFWTGIEPYPAVLFDYAESACLVGDECGNLYDPLRWQNRLCNELHRWKKARGLVPALHLATVFTADYDARDFLDSQGVLTGVQTWAVGNGHDPRALAAAYPGIRFRQTGAHWTTSHGMSQHGRFLDALPEIGAQDVLILSDADVVVQRDLDPDERQAFLRLGGNDVAAGFNAGAGDDLVREAARIGLHDLAPWGGAEALARVPCYNCGVLAARGSTWRRVQKEYEALARDFYARNGSRARCQWLLNLVFHRLGLRVVPLPASVHAHGHFGTPEGIALQPDGVARLGEKPVLFRHALPPRDSGPGRLVP